MRSEVDCAPQLENCRHAEGMKEMKARETSETSSELKCQNSMTTLEVHVSSVEICKCAKRLTSAVEGVLVRMALHLVLDDVCADFNGPQVSSCSRGWLYVWLYRVIDTS